MKQSLRKNWISMIWILLIAISFSWNYYIITSDTLKIAKNKAQSFLDRFWLHAHGILHMGAYMYR